METRRDFLRTLGAGAAALAAGRPAAAQTTQKRELVVAQGGDVSRLDPHMSTSSNDIRITFNLFDNLTNRHPDGSLAPGLATEWSTPDPKTVNLTLRKTTFSDGTPFNSAAVKQAWTARCRAGRRS